MRWARGFQAANPSFDSLISSDAPVLKTTHGRSASGDPAVVSCPEAPQSAARSQARTGIRKRRDPPRRSGEGQPLRPFRSGRRLRASGLVDGGAGSRRRQRAGQARRHGHHHATSAVTVPAIQVRGARGLIALGIGVGHRVGHGIDARTDISLMLVLVVTDMCSVGPGLVRAIRCHRRPAEVEWKQCKQEDGKDSAHGQESSCYRVFVEVNETTRSCGFTSSTHER